MRVAVLAAGSREEVLPLVALGEGLRAAGHTVTLGAAAELVSLAHARGLSFAPLDAAAAALDRPHEIDEPFADRILEEAWVACEDAEAVVWTPGCGTGLQVAEALGVPDAMAALDPATPAADFACPPQPELPLPRPLGRLYNRGGAVLVREANRLRSRRLVNRWRDLLGLRPLPALGLEGRPGTPGHPVLYAFSQRVVPRPAGWGEQVAITGYWPFDADRAELPSTGLERFLAAGSAPVAIVLRGLPPPLAARVTGVVLEGLSYTAERAVLVGGEVGGIPAARLRSVFPVEDAPLDWLLPRVAAVVHAGTSWLTAMVLAAGVPSVLVPASPTHWFWSRQVARMLTAPPPIPASRVSPAQLVHALDSAVQNQRIRAHALLAARLLSDEDGIANAIRALEAAVAPYGQQLARAEDARRASI